MTARRAAPSVTRRTTRHVLAALTVTALLLVASACGNGNQAGSGDTLNWYTSMPQDGADALAQAFTKSSGIKVNVQRIGTTELWQRFLTESSAHRYTADVLSVASWTIVQDAEKQHLIKKFLPDPVDVGGAYTSTEGAVLQDGYAFSSRLLIEAIAYNSKLVPAADVPTTWKDLTKPYWKNRIAMLDPRQDTGGYAAYHQMLQVPAIGWDFFDSLKNQGKTFLSGDSGEILNRVVSGQSQVAILQDVLAWEQIAKGAPVKVVYPPEGVGGTLDYNTLPAKAPHEANAVKFLKYLSSAAANDALVKSIYVYSPRSGAVVEPAGRPKIDQLNLLPFRPAAEAKDFDTFNTRFDSSIGR